MSQTGIWVVFRSGRMERLPFKDDTPETLEMFGEPEPVTWRTIYEIVPHVPRPIHRFYLKRYRVTLPLTRGFAMLYIYVEAR